MFRINLAVQLLNKNKKPEMEGFVLFPTNFMIKDIQVAIFTEIFVHVATCTQQTYFIFFLKIHMHMPIVKFKYCKYSQTMERERTNVKKTKQMSLIVYYNLIYKCL